MTRCAAVCFAPAAGAFRAPLSLSLAAPDSQLRLRSDRPPAAAAIQAYVECNLMHDTATYKVPLAEGNNSEDVAMWPVTPVLCVAVGPRRPESRSFGPIGRPTGHLGHFRRTKRQPQRKATAKLICPASESGCTCAKCDGLPFLTTFALKCRQTAVSGPLLASAGVDERPLRSFHPLAYFRRSRAAVRMVVF